METAPRTLLFVFALLGFRFAYAGGRTPAADPVASHMIGEWTRQVAEFRFVRASV